ncbi:MAG TPA: hypothetical protein VKX17_26445 [Planctomycetota bacterium]|nr:hypothetical protein [Planctomycetota bacterium]
MKDSIVLLHLPLDPGCKAARELFDAGWRQVSSAVYFLRANQGRVSANIRMFSEKFPGPGHSNALRLVEK